MYLEKPKALTYNQAIKIIQTPGVFLRGRNPAQDRVYVNSKGEPCIMGKDDQGESPLLPAHFRGTKWFVETI